MFPKKIYSSVKVSAIGTTTIKNKVRPRSVMGFIEHCMEMGEEEGAGLLVVDADDLSAALLPPVDQQFGLALLLHGHRGPVQH